MAKVSEHAKVGDTMLVSCGSDRTSYTVVEILSPKSVVIQRDASGSKCDNDGVPGGYYVATPDENGGKQVMSLRKTGNWHKKGEPANWWAAGYITNDPARKLHYRDPSF